MSNIKDITLHDEPGHDNEGHEEQVPAQSPELLGTNRRLVGSQIFYHPLDVKRLFQHCCHYIYF
jgi:hypothetical protein